MYTNTIAIDIRLMDVDIRDNTTHNTANYTMGIVKNQIKMGESDKILLHGNLFFKCFSEYVDSGELKRNCLLREIIKCVQHITGGPARPAPPPNQSTHTITHQIQPPLPLTHPLSQQK
jgi:hypothetical protein